MKQLINEAKRMQQLAGLLKEDENSQDYASELVYQNPKPLSNLHTAIDQVGKYLNEVIKQLTKGDKKVANGRELTEEDIVEFLDNEFRLAFEEHSVLATILAKALDSKKGNIPGTDFSMNEAMSVGSQGSLQSTGSDEETDKEVLMAWAKGWFDKHNEWYDWQTEKEITDEIDQGLILTKLAAIYYEEYLIIKKNDERGDDYTIQDYIQEELENNPPNVISLEDIGEYEGYVSQEIEDRIDQILGY